MIGRFPCPCLVALATAMLCVPSIAAAQCRLCATPTTALDTGASGGTVALEVETSLDFDRLILLGQGAGSATLRPDGSRSVSGMVSDVSSRAKVGSVVIHGEAGRAVRVELPSSISLYSVSGGEVTIGGISSDLASSPRLDSTGTLTFRFGGRVDVKGDEEGDYRGDVPLTVEYL